MSQSYRQRRQTGAIEVKLWLPPDVDAALVAVAKRYSRFKTDVIKIALARYLRDTNAIAVDLAERELTKPLRVLRADTTKPKAPLAHQWKPHRLLDGVRVCANCDLAWSRRIGTHCDPKRSSIMRDKG